MIALALLLALSGFAALARSMPKHRDRPASQRSRMGLQSAGWLLLLASMLAAQLSARPSIGIVLWVALLTPATLIVSLVLTFRTKWLSK